MAFIVSNHTAGVDSLFSTLFVSDVVPRFSLRKKQLPNQAERMKVIIITSGEMTRAITLECL